MGNSKQFQWNMKQSQATTSTTNSFSVLNQDDAFKSGNRSKEPYHSKGSMERDQGN